MPSPVGLGSTKFKIPCLSAVFPVAIVDHRIGESFGSSVRSSARVPRASNRARFGISPCASKGSMICQSAASQPSTSKRVAGRGVNDRGSFVMCGSLYRARKTRKGHSGRTAPLILRFKSIQRIDFSDDDDDRRSRRQRRRARVRPEPGRWSTVRQRPQTGDHTHERPTRFVCCGNVSLSPHHPSTKTARAELAPRLEESHPDPGGTQGDGEKKCPIFRL